MHAEMQTKATANSNAEGLQAINIIKASALQEKYVSVNIGPVMTRPVHRYMYCWRPRYAKQPWNKAGSVLAAMLDLQIHVI
jgi:hypothetical protein